MFCFLHDNNELDISFISCSLTDCGYFHSALPLAWLSQSKTPVDLARPFFQNECQSNQDLLQCTVIKLDLPVFLTTCITHNNNPLLSRHQRKYWKYFIYHCFPRITQFSCACKTLTEEIFISGDIWHSCDKWYFGVVWLLNIQMRLGSSK